MWEYNMEIQSDWACWWTHDWCETESEQIADHCHCLKVYLKVFLVESQVFCMEKEVFDAGRSSVTLALSIFHINPSIYRVYTVEAMGS